MTLQEEFKRIEDISYDEGIGYYLLDYTDENEMPNEESKQLFLEAKNAIKKFEAYIKEQASD